MTQKKLFKVLTLAAFVAMIAISPLQASDGCQEKAGCEKTKAEGCEKMKAEGCEKMKAEGCMMFKQIPNLSEEQKGTLEKLHAEHQKLMAAAKADIEKQTLEMKAMMKDPVDIKKIEAEIDEIAKRKADMQKKCLAHHLAVRALLTVEQKAKFDEMGCGMMMGGMEHKGGCQMKQGMKMEKKKCPMAKEEEKK
jgi:Spy/CpxP family protein refolding chaperone